MNNDLTTIREKLKEEFFGIDTQIDQVTKSVETWLSVKDYQNKPMVVCLWGLTGTGKTALINRTIELFNLNKKKFYIKFGSKTSNLDADFELNSCNDTIFVLDEFQYFKTKKEDGSEIERDEDNSTNMIWELLDGGIVNLYGQQYGYNYEKMYLANTIFGLKTIELNGGELNNGIIYHPELHKYLKKLFINQEKKKYIEEEKSTEFNHNETYGNIEDDDDDDDDENHKVNNVEYSKTEIRLRTFMQVNWSILYDYVKYRDIDYIFRSKTEFFNFLKEQNSIPNLIKFLQMVKDAKPKLENRDYTKSLIFVLGNLDECFKMSIDLNSDLDADYFYNKTKKITIIDIRNALLNRFRPEQIARLGSSHIIYPSLNKEAFKSIINKELKQFESMVMSKFNSNVLVKVDKVTFTDEIRDLIYKEGVFPTIGARSVFSIVNEIVLDKFTNIIKTILNIDKNNINIKFSYDKKRSEIEISFYDNYNNLIEKNIFKYNIKVDKLRIEKDKGKQAHRAVHEAGHAVCSVILEKSFPEVIYSVVLNDNSSGFNLLNTDDFYYHRKNTYLNRVSTLLGGYAAEKIVFGKDNISNGSGSDIEKATSLILSLLKDTGFSDKTIGKYISNNFTSTEFETSNYSLIDNNDYMNSEALTSLKSALTKATETLNEQNTLFIKLSEYLSKNPKITNKKLKELTKKYINNIDYNDLFKDKNAFYVNMLNDKLEIVNNNLNNTNGK